MKNKTTIALATAMTMSFFCANSQASALEDRIRAMTASQAASTLGSSSSSSAFIQALKNYDPTTGTSSSLVSKSQVSSSSSSASSLSSLLDQRLAAATLQAQAAKAKATAVNFSGGEYIPSRNVDGYSVTASGVKTSPTINPSAAASTATLVNKVKIQSASAAQQAQLAAAQQAQLAAAQQAQQNAQTKYAALSDYDMLMNTKWGKAISRVQSGSGSASLIKQMNSDFNSIVNMGNDVSKALLLAQSGSGSASLVKQMNSDFNSIMNGGDTAKKYQATINSALLKSPAIARVNLTVSAAKKAIAAIQQGKSPAAYIKAMQAYGNVKAPRPISVPTPIQKMTPYFLSDYGLKDFSQISYKAIRYLTK